MADSKDGTNLSLVGETSTRAGSYANLATVTTIMGDEIIDFFLVDGKQDDGVLTGVMTARVVMNRETLAGLYDAIGKHLNPVQEGEGE